MCDFASAGDSVRCYSPYHQMDLDENGVFRCEKGPVFNDADGYFYYVTEADYVEGQTDYDVYVRHYLNIGKKDPVGEDVDGDVDGDVNEDLYCDDSHSYDEEDRWSDGEDRYCDDRYYDDRWSDDDECTAGIRQGICKCCGEDTW